MGLHIPLDEYKALSFKSDVLLKCDICNNNFIAIKRNIHKHVLKNYNFYCSSICRKSNNKDIYVEYNCKYCGKVHTKHRKYIDQVYCSKSCSNSDRIISEESNNKRRIALKTFYGTLDKPSKREKIKKYCKACNSLLIKKYTFKFCNEECKIVYYKKERKEYYLYRYYCDFKFNVYDYPLEFDFSLLEKHGWYRPKNKGNNLYGVSRDHLYSVNEAYNNNIDPNYYLIQLIVNCYYIVIMFQKERKVLLV